MDFRHNFYAFIITVALKFFAGWLLLLDVFKCRLKRINLRILVVVLHKQIDQRVDLACH